MAAVAIVATARTRTLTDRLIRRDHNRITLPGLRPSIALLAACAAVLAGCSTTTKVKADGTLRVALTEYHVQPQSVQAAAGLLMIVVRNNGRLSHNLVIAQDGHPEVSTKAIAPGQTTELFTDLPPGKYVMASTILADQALGAYGTLTITK
jgi:hypothetical protein